VDLPAPPPVVVREGRGIGWRAGMALLGLFLAATGVALWLWPWLLSWAVAVAFAGAGLLLVVSALLAKGPDAPTPS
jgi:hypothetical protein